MIARNIGQSSGAERPGVAFVYMPRSKLQVSNRLQHSWVAAERKSSPLVNNSLAAQIRIPRQPPEPVEIRHRHWTAEPARVHADIRHTGKSADGTMQDPSAHHVLYRCGLSVHPHVEIQNLFPHRDQEAKMFLLPGVFLSDLQLDGLVGVA